MGCCCSKKQEEERQQVSKSGRWDPPPAPPEEEMVKEVLSETPKPKPKPKSLASYPAHNKLDNNETKSHRNEGPGPKLPLDDRSEQPQPSDEACSLSEATSIASSLAVPTPTRESRECGDTSSSLPKVQYKRNNSNGGNRRSSPSSNLHSYSYSYSGELAAGGKKERSSPAVVVSGCRSGRASPAPPARNGLKRDHIGERSAPPPSGRNGLKRDIGERSGRRSVSPGGKRREVGGANKGGAKDKDKDVVLPPGRRIPPPVLPRTDQQAGQGGGEEEERKEEYPSVSLECFIFL